MPTSAPRRRHDTASLLEVAVRVFTEQGYDGTSMGDLATAAGLASKSSLYQHIDSKEHLLRLALDPAVEPLVALVERARDSGGPALPRLEQVVRDTVALLVAELPSVTLLLRVRGNTGTERWALERRRHIDALLADLVQQAVDAGDLSGAVDPGLVSRLLFGMVNSVVEWWHPAAGRGRTTGPVDSVELADAVLRMSLAGLRR